MALDKSHNQEIVLFTMKKNVFRFLVTHAVKEGEICNFQWYINKLYLFFCVKGITFVGIQLIALGFLM